MGVTIIPLGLAITGEDTRSRAGMAMAELELREVEETGNVLGTGSYGVVVELNVAGLK